MPQATRWTSSDRLELGLFLSVLVVGCLLLVAALNLQAAPAMAAWKQNIQPMQTANVASATLEFAPQSSVVEIPGPLPASAQQMTAPALPMIADKVARPAPETKTFDGKTYRYVKTLKLRVTAYAPDPRCTYPYPGTTTATGASVKTNGGRLVASDPSIIALHSLVVVPGYAASGAVPVLDTGGAIKGNRLDVMMPTFEQAKAWGSRMLEVKIYAPVK